jgi:hypothetical protein
LYCAAVTDQNYGIRPALTAFSELSRFCPITRSGDADKLADFPELLIFHGTAHSAEAGVAMQDFCRVGNTSCGTN